MPDFLLSAWTNSIEILRVYTVHSPRSLEICIEFRFHVPLRNIFLIEHIWRFWETRYFRFRVEIGSRKWPHAVERDKLYIPSKFHSNLPCSFGGEEGLTLKKRDLKFSLHARPLPNGTTSEDKDFPDFSLWKIAETAKLRGSTIGWTSISSGLSSTKYKLKMRKMATKVARKQFVFK